MNRIGRRAAPVGLVARVASGTSMIAAEPAYLSRITGFSCIRSQNPVAGRATGRSAGAGLLHCDHAIQGRAIRALIAVACLLLALPALAQFGRQRWGPQLATPDDFDGSWQFCRLAYQGRGWSTDYPDADYNFSTRLGELTKTAISRQPRRRPSPRDHQTHGRHIVPMRVRHAVAGRIAAVQSR